MARGYTPDGSEYAYNQPRHTGKQGVLLQRTKTIKAGDFLECEIFPVLDMEHGKAAKAKKTPEAMRLVNIRNAKKQIERLANANFGPGDMLCHFTYPGVLPEAEIRRITKNFMSRLRGKFTKRGGAFEYIYVIEVAKKQWHIHMLLRGGVLNRDEVEQVWGHGLARADRYQAQEKGLAGFANYITQSKDTQERLLKRRWACSKGLRQPKITTSDSKFSKRAAEKLARETMEDARALFAKKYPGYYLVEQPAVHYSDFLPGVYIYAFMHKIEGARK